ncbi:hypothetical protein HPB51_009579 [Rhipicephalus microplus]|uniref:Uncharacterized protein n=1 Tax=Rhipicephalus microplus TaxID=6941 RepID=A0A9J6ESD9_RHIMP|nr:hypothetical protein HPB51_009579 [Rhipicephalus microplus]
MQWADARCWPADPVHFWAPSAARQDHADHSWNDENGEYMSHSSLSTGQSTWTRNVTRMLVFSVLLIAVLVASLLLARTNAWMAKHNEANGRPDKHQHLSPMAAGVASRRSSGVGSWMRANASARIAVGPNSDTRKIFKPRAAHKAPTEEAETTEAVTSTLADMPARFSQTAKKRKFCGTFHFTFCGSPGHEFYFDASRGACLSVSDMKGAALCIRGANKFTSLASCDAACGSNADHVEPKCREAASFTECKSEDVVGPLWYYNGHRCEQWDFPGGLCPAANDSQGSLFATSEECRRTCHNEDSRTSRCIAPREVACVADMLKKPYFANLAASGAAERCLKATAKNLYGKLCLAGKNHFNTLETCRKACVH